MVTRLDELKESVRFQACVCEDIGMHVTDANMLLAVAEAAARMLGALDDPTVHETWELEAEEKKLRVAIAPLIKEVAE